MTRGEISVGIIPGASPTDGAVSATFFCGAMTVLRRTWGERLTDQKHLNRLIGLLADSEEAYRALPMPEKRNRRESAKPGNAT